MRRLPQKWVGWREGLTDGVLVGAGVLGVGVVVGIVMDGVLADGVGETEGGIVGVPGAVAKLVMSVHSMGLKASVGAPLDRIWVIPPWCRLRYQAPGPGTLVTPVITRV